jgi:hypothetical protein
MEGWVENPQEAITQPVNVIDTIYGSTNTFSRSRNRMKLLLSENLYHLHFHFRFIVLKKVEQLNISAYIHDRATIFGSIPTLSTSTNQKSHLMKRLWCMKIYKAPSYVCIGNWRMNESVLSQRSLAFSVLVLPVSDNATLLADILDGKCDVSNRPSNAMSQTRLTIWLPP